MSREQANTFTKFRDARDPEGNLGWSARLSRKAVRQAPESENIPDLELLFKMSDDEKVIWRLLKVARKYIDLETLGVLPAERIRGVVRGLVAADVVDILDIEEAKQIVPLEVKRVKDRIAGKEVKKAPRRKSRLKPRVYRPNIGGDPAPEEKKKPAPAPTPAPSAPAPVEMEVSAHGKAIIALVEKLNEKLAEGDHYGFLGVPGTASPQQIKAGYMKRARDLHPDRVMSSGAGNDPKVRAEADVLFKALQDVYGLLSDEQKRAEYDADRNSGSQPVQRAGEKRRRPDDARLMLKKGKHLISGKQYAQAHRHLKMAIDFDDRLVEAAILAAWALYYRDDKPEAERVQESMKSLQQLADENHADAAYRLALIARMRGNNKEHERRIRQACRIDRNHTEASQELRVIDRRRKAGEREAEKGSSGGLFGRLKR